MVAIPAITRDKLASSVVGTPEQDTSGQKIGQAAASAGSAVADVAGQYLVERQQNLDLAETNRLAVGYKMNVVDKLEELKQTYANDPEKVQPILAQYMQDQLSATQQQASNPRTSLMIGRGDPYFDTHIVMGQQDWAFKQRGAINKAAIIDQGNQVSDKAEQIGSSSDPYIVKLNNLLTLHSISGNLVAGAYAAANPTAAAVLERRMPPTIISRGFYGMLRDNPAQAFELTKDPAVQKMFESNPKELDDMHQKAIQRMEGMAKEEKWNQAVQPLIDSPNLIKQIASRQVDYNALEQLPESPLKQQLQKMALDAYPVENGAQRDEKMSKFFADASDIGMNLHHLRSSDTASQLVNFNTELAKARNDGFITQQQYHTMVSRLAVPLRDAMLKLHDPNQYALVKKNGGLTGLFGATHEEPEKIIDKYASGYGVINNWVKAQGRDSDWAFKSQAVQKYLEMSDAVKPEDRDAQGRPFTPETVARKAMGIADGDNIQTPFGLKKITGYDSKSGTPKYEISDEEQSRFMLAKVIMKMGGK